MSQTKASFLVIIIACVCIAILLQFKKADKANDNCCKTLAGCASGPNVSEELCLEMDGIWNDGQTCNQTSGQCE